MNIRFLIAAVLMVCMMGFVACKKDDAAKTDAPAAEAKADDAAKAALDAINQQQILDIQNKNITAHMSAQGLTLYGSFFFGSSCFFRFHCMYSNMIWLLPLMARCISSTT